MIELQLHSGNIVCAAAVEAFAHSGTHVTCKEHISSHVRGPSFHQRQLLVNCSISARRCPHGAAAVRVPAQEESS